MYREINRQMYSNDTCVVASRLERILRPPLTTAWVSDGGGGGGGGGGCGGGGRVCVCV